MQATLYTHLRVPRHMLDLEQVARDLYIPNLKHAEKLTMGYQVKAGELPGIFLYEEDGDYVILPRGYDPPWNYPGNPYLYRELSKPKPIINDLRPAWPQVDGFEFYGELRDKQLNAAETLIATRNDKLLCLGCGKGKTVLALWYAAMRSVSTLVVVDQNFLIRQWQKRILTNLHLSENEVGLIQGSTFRIGDQITIASLATIRGMDLGPEFFDFWGLVIFDEGHVLGAQQASKLLPNFPGERLILTATPERKDGMHPVFMLHAGGMQPCFVDLSKETASHWTFVQLPQVLSDEQLDTVIEVGARKRKKRLADALWQKVPGFARPRFNRPTYESAAAVSNECNAQILHEVFLAEKAGRNVLVLGSRTEQLELLCNAAKDTGTDASLVIGRVKDDERDAAFESQVIFATWQIAGKALDIDRLDTLILLYPTDDEGFLRQAVGRIEDRASTKLRKSVVVCFVHGAYDTFIRKADKMTDVIKEIDPGATIKWIQRQPLLPKLERHDQEKSGGGTRLGTEPTRSPIRRVFPRP